ncbi:MAG: hypothetical protein Q7S44_00190 [bacterium]|nr:hypothetical protein [bacterium]
MEKIAERAARLIIQPPDHPDKPFFFIDTANPLVYTSGTKHPVYNRIRDMQTPPQTRREIVSLTLQKIEKMQKLGFDLQAVAPVPDGATWLGNIVAYLLDIPSIKPRKDIKGHGIPRVFDGAIMGGLNYLLVEDVFSTGGSTIDTAEKIRRAGGVVTDALSILNYDWEEAKVNFARADIKPHSLTTISVVLREARKLGLIDPRHEAALEDWQRDPLTWAQRNRIV